MNEIDNFKNMVAANLQSALSVCGPLPAEHGEMIKEILDDSGAPSFAHMVSAVCFCLDEAIEAKNWNSLDKLLSRDLKRKKND